MSKGLPFPGGNCKQRPPIKSIPIHDSILAPFLALLIRSFPASCSCKAACQIHLPNPQSGMLRKTGPFGFLSGMLFPYFKCMESFGYMGLVVNYTQGKIF